MKHLKYFDEISEYDAFKDSSDYVLPNVSWIEATKSINFNGVVLNLIELYPNYSYPEVAQNLYNIFTKYCERLGHSVTNSFSNIRNGSVSVIIDTHPIEQSLYFVYTYMPTENVEIQKLDADDVTYINSLVLNYKQYREVCNYVSFNEYGDGISYSLQNNRDSSIY